MSAFNLQTINFNNRNDVGAISQIQSQSTIHLITGYIWKLTPWEYLRFNFAQYNLQILSNTILSGLLDFAILKEVCWTSFLRQAKLYFNLKLILQFYFKWSLYLKIILVSNEYYFLDTKGQNCLRFAHLDSNVMTLPRSSN